MIIKPIRWQALFEGEGEIGFTPVGLTFLVKPSGPNWLLERHDGDLTTSSIHDGVQDAKDFAFIKYSAQITEAIEPERSRFG